MSDSDPVHEAAREVVERVRDEEWWESRAVCPNLFHTTRDPRPLGAQEERHCPDCYSSWWATDGSLPGDGSYAIEAVLRAAMSAAPPKPVVVTDEMVKRAKDRFYECSHHERPVGHHINDWWRAALRAALGPEEGE